MVLPVAYLRPGGVPEFMNRTSNTVISLRVFLQLIIAIVLSSVAGQAQPGKSPAVTPGPIPAQSGTVAAGTVNGSEYSNNYFGLRLTIPAGWNVQGDDVKKEIVELGKAQIVAKDEQERRQFDAAADRTSNLLTISKHPLGKPSAFNAIFMAIAEPVPLAATPTLYVQKLKEILQQSQVPVTFVDEKAETINNIHFETLTVTFSPKGELIRQKYHILIRKGYALGLISTVISDSDTETMNGIMNTVSVSKQ